MKKQVKNIRELSAIVGLSVSTVSRVLNGKAQEFRISEKAAEKIKNAAIEYNYAPSNIARGLKISKTSTIGLVIPDVANPFFASLARYAEIKLREKGYSLIFGDSLDNTDIENDILNLWINRKVEGIIISPVGYDSKYINELAKKDIPVVLVDRHFPDTSLPYVTTNNIKGGRMAAQLFLKYGHTRVACIQGLRNITANNERLRGFREVFHEYGIELSEEYIPGDDFSSENGYHSTQNLLTLQAPPTAIFTLGNYISLGCIKAIKETEKKIPQDISLIAYDEQVYSQFLATPLTTIRQPIEQMAFEAVNMLLNIINGKKIKRKQIILDPELIVRESVGNK